MKKSYWHGLYSEALEGQGAAERRAEDLAREVRRLERELDAVKTTWRPVPMVHEWQPKNPQCALCDEPRDAARHRVEAS